MATEQTHRYRLALDMEADEASDLSQKLVDLAWELSQGKLTRSGVSASPGVTCIHTLTDKGEG